MLKGHGNEADFLGFLHESVRQRSLTLHFEPFRFWRQIRGDNSNRKTTPQLAESGSRRLSESPSFSFKHSKADSPTPRVSESSTPRLAELESRRLPESPSQRVIFRLQISPQIRSQNRNGSKGSVRDLWGTNFCKNPRKSASLPCPFKKVC